MVFSSSYSVFDAIYGRLVISGVLNLGFTNPQGFTGRFPRVLGWQLSFHVLIFFNILY